MNTGKENSLILTSLRELNETMQILVKELKKSNTINEKFLLIEKKKTLLESKHVNQK